MLTTKPVLYVANVAEDDVANAEENPYVKSVKEFAESEHAEVIVISARAEEEIAELDDEDKAEFLEALGIEESGLDQLIRALTLQLGNKRFVHGLSEKESKRLKLQELFIQISSEGLSVQKLFPLKIWISMAICMQQKKLGVFV